MHVAEQQYRESVTLQLGLGGIFTRNGTIMCSDEYITSLQSYYDLAAEGAFMLIMEKKEN